MNIFFYYNNNERLTDFHDYLDELNIFSYYDKERLTENSAKKKRKGTAFPYGICACCAVECSLYDTLNRPRIAVAILAHAAALEQFQERGVWQDTFASSIRVCGFCAESARRALGAARETFPDVEELKKSEFRSRIVDLSGTAFTFATGPKQSTTLVCRC